MKLNLIEIRLSIRIIEQKLHVHTITTYWFGYFRICALHHSALPMRGNDESLFGALVLFCLKHAKGLH